MMGDIASSRVAERSHLVIRPSCHPMLYQSVFEEGYLRVGRRKDKDRRCHSVHETVRNAGHLSPSLDQPEQFIEPESSYLG